MTFMADYAQESAGYVVLHRTPVLLCRKHWNRGAHEAAAVLERLLHWRAYGHEWLWKRDEDWWAEAIVTASQARKILSRMKQLGWVDTKLAPRPMATKGYPVTWYRLNIEAIEAAFAEGVETGPEETLAPKAEDSSEKPSALRPKDDPNLRPYGRQTLGLTAEGQGSAPYIGTRDLGTRDLGNTDPREPAPDLELSSDPPPPRKRPKQPPDLAGFEEFWEAYPRRKGKRAGTRMEASHIWSGMSAADREMVMANLPRYVLMAGDSYPKDAHRWLKHGLFREYGPEMEMDELASASRTVREGLMSAAEAGERWLAERRALAAQEAAAQRAAAAIPQERLELTEGIGHG